MDSNTERVLQRPVESAGRQIVLTHPDNPAVFGILRATKVKSLKAPQTANPHLGRAAASREKGFAFMLLGHQGC